MNSGQYPESEKDDVDWSLGLRQRLENQGITPDKFKTLPGNPAYEVLTTQHFSDIKNQFFPEGIRKGGIFVTKRSKKSEGPKKGYPGPPTQYEEQSNYEDVPNVIEDLQYDTSEDGIKELRKVEYVEPSGRRTVYDVKTNKTKDNPRAYPIKPGQTLNEQEKRKPWYQSAYEGTVGPMDSTIQDETLAYSSNWPTDVNKNYQQTGNVPPGYDLKDLNAVGYQPWEDQSTITNQTYQGHNGWFGKVNFLANPIRHIKDAVRNPINNLPKNDEIALIQPGANEMANLFGFEPNHVLKPGELPYATNPNTGMGYQKLPNQELFGRFESDKNDSGLITAGKSIGNVGSALGNLGVGLGEFVTGPVGIATAGMGGLAAGSIETLAGASIDQVAAEQALKAAAAGSAERTLLTANLAKASAAKGRAVLAARAFNAGEAGLQSYFAGDLAHGAWKSGEATYNSLTTPTFIPGPDQFTEGGYVGTHPDWPGAAYNAAESLSSAFFAKEIAKHTLTGSGRNVIQPELGAANHVLGNLLASVPGPEKGTPYTPWVRPSSLEDRAEQLRKKTEEDRLPKWGPGKEDTTPAATDANYTEADAVSDRINNTIFDINNPAPYTDPAPKQKSQTLRDLIRKQNFTRPKYEIYDGPLREQLKETEKDKPVSSSEIQIPPEVLAQIDKESRDPNYLMAGSTGRIRPKVEKDATKDIKPGEEPGRPGEKTEPGGVVLKPGDTPGVVQTKPGLAEEIAAAVPKPEAAKPVEQPVAAQPEKTAPQSQAEKAAQARLNSTLDKIDERRAFTQANLESGRITQELADTYFARFDSAEKKAQDTFMEETKPSQRFLGVDVGNTGRTTVWNNQGRPRPQPPEKPKTYSATVPPTEANAKPTIPGLPQLPQSALEAASDATKMGMTGQTKSQFADRNVPNLNGRQAFEKNNGMLSRLTYDQLKDLHDTTVADPGHNPKFAAAVRDEMGSRERKVSDTYSTNQEGRNAISSNLKPELMTDAELKNVTDNHPELIKRQREIITGHNRGDFNSDLGKRSAEAEAAIRKLNELKYQLKFAREEANKRVRVKIGAARPDGTPIVKSTERKLAAKRYDPVTGEEVKGPVVKRDPVQALNHARGDHGLLSRDELVAARDALKAQGRDYHKRVDEDIKKRDLENERVHKRLYGSKAAEIPNPRTMDRAEIDRRLAELPGELKQAEERYAQTKSPEDAKHIYDIKTDLSGFRKEAENRDALESQSLKYDRSKNPNYKQVSGDIQGRPTKSSVKPGVGPFNRDVSKPDVTPIAGRDPNVIRAEGAAAYEAENQQAARTANQETIDRANAENRQTQQTEQTAPAEAPVSEARQAEPVQTEAAKPDVTEEHAAKQETVASINDNADILDNMDSTKEISRILNGTRKEPGLVEQVRKTAEEWNNATSPAEREVARKKMLDHIDELTSIRDDLQDRHDNTPESLQSTDAYDRREQMISDLDEAISGLEEQELNMRDNSSNGPGNLTPESNKMLPPERDALGGLSNADSKPTTPFDENATYEEQKKWVDDEIDRRTEGLTYGETGDSYDYTHQAVRGKFLDENASNFLYTDLKQPARGGPNDRFLIQFNNLDVPDRTYGAPYTNGTPTQLTLKISRVNTETGNVFRISELRLNLIDPFTVGSNHNLRFKQYLDGNEVQPKVNAVAAAELLKRIDALNISVPQDLLRQLQKRADEIPELARRNVAKKYDIKRETGNRTYTPRQIASDFIGRVASNNPEITKGLEISFRSSDNNGYLTTYKIQLKEKGQEIGSIYLEKKSDDTVYLGMSGMEDAYQGKGLGTLMYSEVAERLRSLGVKRLTGWVVDSKERPNQIRQRVIDAVNKELGYTSDETSRHAGDVESTLRPDAYYSPEYDAEGLDLEAEVNSDALNQRYSNLSAGAKSVAISIESGKKTVEDILKQMAEQGVNKGDDGFRPNEGKIARLLLKHADDTSLSSVIRAISTSESGQFTTPSMYTAASPTNGYSNKHIKDNLSGKIPNLTTGAVAISRSHLQNPNLSMQVVLHEITHAVTIEKVNRAIFGITNSFNSGNNAFGESGAKYVDRIKAYIKDPNSDKSIVKIARSYLKLLSTLDKEADSPVSLSKANKATGDVNADNVIGSGVDGNTTGRAARQGLYGATDLGEFISEAMTNPDFQARLSTIKMGERSVWENFKKSVAEMLGIAEGDTALAHTMDGVMEVASKRLERFHKPGESYKDSLQSVREQRFQSEGDARPQSRAIEERVNDDFNIDIDSNSWAKDIKSIRDIDADIADIKTPGNYNKAKVDALERQKNRLIDKATKVVEKSPYYNEAVRNVGTDASLDTIINEINHLDALARRDVPFFIPGNYKPKSSKFEPESNRLPARNPNEGNRVYTEQQMASGFIGRVARDNPGFKKQFKIEFKDEDTSHLPEPDDMAHKIEMENEYNDQQAAMEQQAGDTETVNTGSNAISRLDQESYSGDNYNEDLGFEDQNYNPGPGTGPPGARSIELTIKTKQGDYVGQINVSIDEAKPNVAYLSQSNIEGHMQGQGIGKLMYSEMAERLRSKGITELTGWIADSKLRPNKIRQRIIDAVNKDLGYSDKTSMKKESISSALRPEAYYSPDLESKGESEAPVFNMTPVSNHMPAENGRQFIAQEKQAAANAVQSAIEGFNSLKPETMKELKDKGVGIVTLGWLRGSSAQLDKLAEIHNIREITEIRALLMGNNAGEMGMARGEGFHTAVSAQNKIFQNKLNNILKPFENELKLLSEKEQSAKLEEIGRAIVSNRTHPDPAIAAAVKQFRAVFKELHDYQIKAGVKLGDMGGTYMPRILKIDEVLKNSEQFIDAATKAYRQSGLSEAEAKTAAQDWFDNILRNDEGFSSGGTSLTFDSGMHNGEPKHTRDRVFGPDAERFMEPFYNRNIYDALTTYIGRAVKTSELTRRFGVDFSKYKDMQDRIIAKGPNGAKILGEVNTLVASQIAPSQARTKLGRIAADANSLYQSIRFLTNATLSSMSEPIVNGMRTGNVMDAITSMGDSVQYAYRNARDLAPDYHEKLAQDLGIIQAHLATSAIATSVDTRYLDVNSSRFTKTTINGFFRGTGLHQWTEGTRVASVKIGETFLSRLASDIQEGGKPYQLSARLLTELGVTDKKAMSSFIKRLETMTEEERLRAISNPRHRQAQEYRQALRKYSEQVIMNPNAGTRSKLAAHPLGAFIFGLQSYQYAFHENVLKRMGRILVNEAILNKGEMSPANRMMLMGAFMSAPIFLAGQYAQGEIRDEAFTDPARANDPKLTLGTKLARMLSRAGGLGRLDAPVNVVAGLKYNKAPETALVGPTASDASSTFAEIVRMFGKENSPNTNTQERKTARSVYNSVIQPGISTLASRFPGVTGRLASTGIHYAAKHPGVREAVVEHFAGPPVDPRQDNASNENWVDDVMKQLSE
jgi:L-amino acid N-acyltransferase YncA